MKIRTTTLNILDQLQHFAETNGLVLVANRGEPCLLESHGG